MLKKIANLFVKPEPKKEKEQPQAEQEKQQEYIAFDDFTKVIIVAGTVKEAEEVPKSSKLLKLQVDCGEHGMRQILSGVKKDYSPQDLVDKQGMFVVNLAPRKMMGMESQGMMLFLKDAEGALVMATVTKPVPNGTRLM